MDGMSVSEEGMPKEKLLLLVMGGVVGAALGGIFTSIFYVSSSLLYMHIAGIIVGAIIGADIMGKSYRLLLNSENSVWLHARKGFKSGFLGGITFALLSCLFARNVLLWLVFWGVQACVVAAFSGFFGGLIARGCIGRVRAGKGRLLVNEYFVLGVMAAIAVLYYVFFYGLTQSFGRLE